MYQTLETLSFKRKMEEESWKEWRVRKKIDGDEKELKK